MLAGIFQKRLFAFSAISLIATTLLLSKLTLQTEIMMSGVLIVLLGVPHGALDFSYARKAYGVKKISQLLLFMIGYLLLCGLVVLTWLQSPLTFLVIFLIGSGFHFSGDANDRASIIERFVYGLSVISLPTLFHHNEIVKLFDFLVGSDNSILISKGLVLVAYLVLALLLVSLVIMIRDKRFSDLPELLLVAAVSLFVSPLLAFSVYFCLLHGFRHVIRTNEVLLLTRKEFLIEGIFPVLALIAAGAITWTFQKNIQLEAKIIQYIFVSLAALTAPHMLIVEPIRIQKWILNK